MLSAMLPVLTRASLEGALLAALVWLVVRTVPRLSPSVRTVLWWCVAAKFVVALVWRAPIALPLLPASNDPATVAVSETKAAERMTNAQMVGAPLAPRKPDHAQGTPRSTRAPSSPPHIPWTTLVLTVWGAGLLVSMGRMLRAWQDTNRVVARSAPGDEALHATVRELSRMLGVQRAAEVRVSTEIESPLITGIRQPVILVPAGRFPLLTDEQQRMALCHELAHMKRGDLWLGCVPAAVERCFFFHPLARLAAREYAFWREAACDEAVLATLHASPQSYGRLLLALGVSRQSATFAAAGAAWSFSNLKRRITMLSHPSSSSRGGRALAACAVALAVVAIAPVKAVARSAAPSERLLVGVTESNAPSFTEAAVQTPSNVSTATSTAITEMQSEAATPVAPRTIADSSGKAFSTRTAAPSTDSSAASVVAVNDSVPIEVPAAQDRETQDRQDDVRFVYFNGDRTTTISGSSNDASRARRYQRSNEPLLWFRRDGREYIVRDSRVLRDVEDLWAPVNEIGEQQGKIGAKQGAIGAEQGRHGAKQGEIGAAQGVVGAKQGVVAARLGLLAARESQGVSGSERRDIEREREELRRDMRELDREMEALSKRMRDYDPPMRDLGDEMSALGREMSALGRRMNDATRRANSGMQSLIDRAIRNGTAEEIR